MIGIMGGTFSPIHYGHLLISEHIREEFNLSKILFVPAKKPPHKDFTQIIEAEDRLNMVKLAIQGNPFFEVSDLELRREGASYTIDSIHEFSKLFGPQNDIGLIIGADSLVQIETWRSYTEIMKLVTLIVAARPDTDMCLLDEKIYKLKKAFNARILKSSGKALDYSSTDIRERVKKGQSIRYRVPPEVILYIDERVLYH
jgi:nicotinate-nucleotide adenylyltransferase